MSAAEPISAVKLALLANQVRAQLDGNDALAAEPIAVIGIGCRFPGGANSPAAFWDVIRTGVDAISEVPADRWDADEFYDPDPQTPGRMNTRWGGFIDGIDQFDAAYFGISPREAAHMDPQQRMVMEVAIEALDRAGQPVAALAGSLTGVFVASTLHDYATREHAGVDDIQAYSITGNVDCIIPNRLSFTLDLRGPSVSVDTACSSSLVAIHLACQSLRSRDSDLALAGGVNALLSPEPTVGLAKWGLMAPDGRCKTFDARADGFVRSEGCGVVVLKRLGDALAANDPIQAVIRGSAVNQDGRSTAMTAPNGLAQQDVIRRALRTGQVDPAQIGCVELHGTGTVLGDPIEVEALAATLGAATPGGLPVVMTAVKTNIGHLEAASGVAGLIKAILCVQHGEVPPPVHFEQLNPHIELEDTRLVIPAETYRWPDGSRRLAGVSSFGFGGTNAHAVVEQAPQLPPATSRGGLPVLVLSARDPFALREVAMRVADDLDRAGSADELVAVAATSARRRTVHDERLAVLGSTPADVAERLRAFAAGQRNPSIVAGRHEPGARHRIAFVMSGQGNQWPGMARELLEREQVFRDAFEACDVLVREIAGWSVREELLRDEAASRLERTEVAQPVLFAMQVGLAALWRSWGVEPDAVVGHSVGEVAAAHVAGALDLRDAIGVIVARGAAMGDAFGTGAMASIELGASDVAAAIATYGDRLSIAAINAPDTTVVSGEADALAEVVAALQGAGASVRALPVTYPFHSAQMAPCAERASAALQGLRPGPTSLRFVSTVTGAAMAGERLGAAHWAANIAEPVRFADAIAALAASGCDVFVELGPHPVLGGAIVRTVEQGGATAPIVVSSLRRSRDAVETIAIALGELHCHGVTVGWSAVWPGRQPLADLPPYPWQHRRHWSETWQPVPSTANRAASSGRPRHANPFVGAPLRSPAIVGSVYEALLTPDTPALIGEHRIGDLALVPGTALMETAVAAFQAAGFGVAAGIDGLQIDTALAVPDGPEPTTMQIHLRPVAGGADFTVSSSVGGGEWTAHATGRVVVDDVPGEPAIDVDALRRRCTARVGAGALYDRFDARGTHFGPTFRAVDEVWVGDGEAVARLVAPAAVLADAAPYRFHPALLDAAVHPIGALLDGDAAVLPVELHSLRLLGRPVAEMWSHVRLRSEPDGQIVTVDVALADGAGNAIATFTGLRLVRADASAVARATGRVAVTDETAVSLYAPSWVPSEDAPSATPAGPWLVLTGDEGSTSVAVAGALRALGLADHVVTAGALDGSGGGGPFAEATEIVDLRPLDLAAGAAGAAVDAQVAMLTATLRTTLASAASGARTWLVTAGAQPASGTVAAPEQATVWGLGAGVLAEDPSARLVRVDVDPAGDAAERAADIALAIGGGAGEDGLAVRSGRLLAPRLVELAAADALPGDARTRLATSSPGLLDGLHREPLAEHGPGPGEIEIEVDVAGLNFRDVLMALDLYPEPSSVFGDECVGAVTRIGAGVERFRPGDHVLAMARGAFATHVVTAADLAYAVPSGMADAAAATIPITFLTAQHALVELGGLRAGERVLVHAGAGGVGMAAIQIAQRIGAEVIATAGSDHKRAVLAELGVAHVFDSRSVDFADGVRAATGGAGVDVVLNSLAGEFIPASVGVLATGGRFLEIGRRDVWRHERMAAERPDVAYHIVFLGDISVNDPPAIQAMYRQLLPRFERGELRPLPHVDFAAGEELEAFRYMAQARHVGKVVVRQRRATANGTALITGGLGGVGSAVAHHLAAHGVSRLVLAGRRADDDVFRPEIEAIAALGAEVVTVVADVADAADAARLLAEVDRVGPPLTLVVHAAGVTADASAGALGEEQFAAVLDAKVTAARHLHDLTADRPDVELVLMSASSTILGAAGQANYVAANAYLDALAAARAGAGLPGVSIGWGVWDRVGMTARLDGQHLARLARRGLLPFSAAAGLAAFDRARVSGLPHVLAARLDVRALDDRAVVSTLRSAHHGADSAPRDAASAGELLASWAATVPGLRRSAIAAFVEQQARAVLGLASGVPIPARQPLNEIGLDSLMAVELRNAIGVALGAPQPATLLFDHPTTAALVEHLLVIAAAAAPGETSATAPDDDALTTTATTVAGAAPELDGLAEMSEEEAEALLLAELDSSERTS